MENYFWKDILEFITNRLVIMGLVVIILFVFLVNRLFDMQIVNGQYYLDNLEAYIVKDISVPAPRGNIVDRYGRPLAINQSAFNIKLDPSIQVDNWAEVLYSLIRVLEKHGEEYIDELPISLEEPYTFTFTGTNPERREELWKTNMDLTSREQMAFTAEETFHYLIDEKFKIREVFPDLPNSEYRKILSLRSALYLKRFNQYSSITVATGVSDKTVTVLEEDNASFPGVFVDTESLRVYPQGKYFSHILGYTGTINQEEYDTMKKRDYTMSDVIGKTGLERSYEDNLRGRNGTLRVKVNSSGRRVDTLAEGSEPAMQGDRVFLTIDQDLQQKTYDILEYHLKQVLISKMTVSNRYEDPITSRQVLGGIIMNNNLSMKKIFEADPDETPASYAVYQYVLSVHPEASVASNDDIPAIRDIIAEGVESGRITQTEMLLVFLEQEIITGDEEFESRLRRGAVSPLTVILNKIQEDELTPQMINLEPATGSVVIIDAANGDVLAAVGYPSYDNNQLVNNFNNEYYYKLSGDNTSPMYNRAFSEPRAPGSTFKMITAAAGLESEVISPTTSILDEVTYTKAGSPYTRCWSSISHGRINVSRALEVSCNYFFCETAYRLGNSRNNNTLEGIQVLNDYMDAFGLNTRSGVEIGEFRDIYPEDLPVISGPAYKEYTEKARRADVPKSEYDWYDGDTVKTAIGQAKNNYTAATMAKYISVLATRGVRYQLHLVDKVTTQTGLLVDESLPNIEHTLDLKDSTWDAIYQGMVASAQGRDGTGRSAFGTFPVTVAGKTGTAQENLNKSDHSSFGGFAPYEDPLIAVYVVIPFGDTRVWPASASQVARDVIAVYLGLESEPEHPAAFNTLVP